MDPDRHRGPAGGRRRRRRRSGGDRTPRRRPDRIPGRAVAAPPLLLASAADNVDVARLLVVLGADPDAQDDQQDSAWLVTGVTGSVAMLETLLPAHPDLALRNRFGGVSVIPASERGPCRLCSAGGRHRHRRQPRQRPRLDRDAGGDRLRRRLRSPTRRSSASCWRPEPTRRSPTRTASRRCSTPGPGDSGSSPTDCRPPAAEPAPLIRPLLRRRVSSVPSRC